MGDPIEGVFTTFPELETERLLLRQICREDAEAIFTIYSDDAVTEFYDLDTFHDIDDAYELIDYFAESYFSERQIRWGIERKADGLLIGTCGFVALHHHRAEIGYDLARPFWRKGYMTEALEGLLELAFDEMTMNRVEALVMPGNQASTKLLETLGFTREGVLRQYDYFKDAFHDLCSYSLLADDYAAMYA